MTTTIDLIRPRQASDLRQRPSWTLVRLDGKEKVSCQTAAANGSNDIAYLWPTATAIDILTCIDDRYRPLLPRVRIEEITD